jgi:hypothetical protein
MCNDEAVGSTPEYTVRGLACRACASASGLGERQWKTDARAGEGPCDVLKETPVREVVEKRHAMDEPAGRESWRGGAQEAAGRREHAVGTAKSE